MFNFNDAFEIFSKFYNEDLSEIPEPGRSIIQVISTKGVIDNGGFFYFMESDFPDGIPHINLADCYETINLKPAAEVIREACSLVGNVVGLPYEQRRIRFDKNAERLEELFIMYLRMANDIESAVKKSSEKFCSDFNAHLSKRLILKMKYYLRKIRIK